MRHRFSLGLSLLVAACAAAPNAPPVAPASPPVASAAAPAATAEAPPEPPAPSRIPSTWDAKKQAAHVLARLAYGPRPGEVDALAKAGVDKWIHAQLAPQTIPDDVVDAKLRAMPTFGLTSAELKERYPRPGKAAKAMAAAMTTSTAVPPLPAPAPTPTPPPASTPMPPAAGKPGDVDAELATQKVMRAVESERQLQEVLVDFWMNHFNVFRGKGDDRWLLPSYERDAIRPHVFGRFRDLLEATAKHPAMLYYLDNWLSVADPPPRATAAPAPKRPAGGLNENYGRELLELHTLGVDGGYTQDDVRETARAFTGWTIDRATETFLFRPGKHDRGAKTVLGHALPAGRGEEDGEAVLDLVASHPKTAELVARKLCTKFVSDDPPPALVARVAETFQKSGGDLSAVYDAIFFSPEMWSDAAFASKIKTPLEVAVSAARAVGATVAPDQQLGAAIARMGEPLYGAQPPTGYKETKDAWVSTGALVARINFGLALGAGRVRGVTFDRAKLVGAVPSDDSGVLVDRLAGQLLTRPLETGSRDTILAELGASIHGVPYGEPSPNALPHAIGLLLGSPEFQSQ